MPRTPRTRASAQSTGPSADALRQFVRTEGVRYLDYPNINSVGIGRKVDTAKGQTDEICVQFTVDRKASPEQLERLETRMVPPTFVIDGHIVKSDVVQRRFENHYKVIAEAQTLKDPRKSRQEVLRPGLSIANVRSSAGTLGAIVYDRDNGQPLTLSNWHVLHTPEGRIGDDIAQPGPFDDNDTQSNIMGKLVRSHLGPAGDCAVASILGRQLDQVILGVPIAPQRLGKAELGDIVIKSGRTTAITYGEVTRIEVQSKMQYGDLNVVIGGFEIGYDAKHKPGDGEISKGGDSGSAWIAVDPKSGKPTDILLGLHFAGEAGEDTPEFALACNASAVFEKLNIALSPPTSVTPSDAEPAGATASKRRGKAIPQAARARTFGGPGYNSKFLGTSIPLPTPTQALKKDLVGADGDTVAHYTHFTLSMRRSRRLCAYAAWNIDGEHVTKVDKEATWTIDSRIPVDAQIDNALYANTKFDRGHVAKREDLVWGAKSEAKRANDDSFCYTNATPQHEKFNRLAPALWKSLEDEIFRQLKPQKMRISLFGGPIFHADDRAFVSSSAPNGTPKIRIPREFYKIVAYHDEAAGRLKAHAFVLSQAQLVSGKLELIEPEALDLTEFRMYQVTIPQIESKTGLKMPALARLDTKLRTPSGESLGAEAIAEPHEVSRLEDVL